MEPHPYRQAFSARDLDGLVALLADNVVFHSPVLADTGFEGRRSVEALLSIVLDAVTDLSYTHELAGERTRVLISDARVGGKPIKATTLLELDADGKIREIWMMVRPLTGVVAIAEEIGAQLAERQGPGRGPTLRALTKPLAGLAAVTNWTGSRIVAGLNRSTS
jgi:SnoaL-like domain